MPDDHRDRFAARLTHIRTSLNAFGALMNTTLAAGLLAVTSVLSLRNPCKDAVRVPAAYGGLVSTVNTAPVLSAPAAPRVRPQSGMQVDREAGGSTQALAQTANERRSVTLAIRGMTCGGCVLGTRTALRRLPGVVTAVVSYERATAVVTYDSAKVTVAQMIAAIRTLRYTATVVASAAS